MPGASPFVPISMLKFDNYRDSGDLPGRLPIPVRRNAHVHLALLLAVGDPIARIDFTPADLERIKKEVSTPSCIKYIDPRTGDVAKQTPYFNEGGPKYFGIPAPPSSVIGRLDDPNWLSKDRLEALRGHVYSALDVLLPLFADESRPWTEEANTAAREVRDFFPLAAEPGLWPYYKAEGKDFFAWVEKNAPPAKAALPWNEPAK